MSGTTDVLVLWRFPLEGQDRQGCTDRTSQPKRARAICAAKDGTFFIATMPAQEPVVNSEITGELCFRLEDGVKLAEEVLAGSQQAMTRPGAMRIIAATAKVLGGMLHEPAALDAVHAFAAEGEGA